MELSTLHSTIREVPSRLRLSLLLILLYILYNNNNNNNIIYNKRARKRRGGEKVIREHYLLFIRVFVIYSNRAVSKLYFAIRLQIWRISFAIYSLFILLFIRPSDILYSFSLKNYTKYHSACNT